MRHYKSKYGRQIGRLMNQLLGVPFSEPSTTEPMELDISDEEEEPEANSLEVFDHPPYSSNSYTARADDRKDSTTASKDIFEDDDEDLTTRKRSSSSDLKNLLRDNFEMQRKRQSEKNGSSERYAP